MCVPVLGAPAYASTSTLFTGATACARSIRYWNAAACCIFTDYRQHVSRVAVQRSAMLGPLCNCCVFSRRAAATSRRWASVGGRILSYKSVRLSPVIIGVVVSVCHAEIFDFGQLLRT